MGLLKGEKATCYPGFEKYIKDAEIIDAPVVVSGKYVLGNGPSNALSWALTIVDQAVGKHVAVEVANGMLYYPDEAGNMELYFG